MISEGFNESSVPDQSGKCFIVTGANIGIGFEVTRVLALRGARVILGCRDESKAEDAITRIRRITSHVNLDILPIDLADLVSIQDAAKHVEREVRLDGLINNAGVMAPPLLRTKQGFELQFGVNHLGCYALTSLLLPKLSETNGSRVIVTSSVAHKGASIVWDDIHADQSYKRMERYAASKLANALFFFELDRRLRAVASGVTAVGCHPGIASTNLGRYMGPLQVLNPIAKIVLNSAAKGAWPALQAATGNIQPGGYYGPTGLLGIRGISGEVARSADAQSPELASKLWELSVAATGIDPGLPPVTQ
ncbi:oxidoreductase [Pokkaliibacter plantistimulans]|uniref:Oxidoreductase n=1 Tax=Proteobacteria bacterium 228 TaxID=2083153 RepID=A0A2S5KSA9_9PROT|nr:oxidoreductase [Pokkaliibacter plantistimulans]